MHAWLPYYPDPDLMHTDGGTHFDNTVIEQLTQRRGWKHTICTPHAKWANGVAERNVKEMKDIMTQLCRDLDVPQNKWPTILPMVQTSCDEPKEEKIQGQPFANTTNHRHTTTLSCNDDTSLGQGG